MKGFRPRGFMLTLSSSFATIAAAMAGKHAGNSIFMPSVMGTFRFRRPISNGPRPPVYKNRSGWLYDVAGPNSREAKRRVRQGAHPLQRNSHKPGTVQPRHIFGGEA